MPDDSGPGLLLLTYLVHDPYEEGGGARLVIGEACLEYVPARLLQALPEGGLRGKELHELLDGTRFEALALWADTLEGDSTFSLSLDSERASEGWDLPGWTEDEVRDLTSEWQRSDVILRQINELIDWLEIDLGRNFRELLRFIEERWRILRL